jgi:MinD superfamily P-loop ATPase
VVNKTPPAFDHQDVRRQVAETYGCEVAAVIPHSDELMTLASAGVFIMRHPTLPLAEIYRELGEIVRKG